MKGPTPRRLRKYVAKCLRLKGYLQSPGDGRSEPRLPAHSLLWALLMGRLLRCASPGNTLSLGVGGDCPSTFAPPSSKTVFSRLVFPFRIAQAL